MTGPAEVPTCELPALASHKEVDNEEVTENFEEQLDNETEKVDYEADRDYTHELVGRKLKVCLLKWFLSWSNIVVQQRIARVSGIP